MGKYLNKDYLINIENNMEKGSEPLMKTSCHLFMMLSFRTGKRS